MKQNNYQLINLNMLGVYYTECKFNNGSPMIGFQLNVCNSLDEAQLLHKDNLINNDDVDAGSIKFYISINIDCIEILNEFKSILSNSNYKHNISPNTEIDKYETLKDCDNLLKIIG